MLASHDGAQSYFVANGQEMPAVHRNRCLGGQRLTAIARCVNDLKGVTFMDHDRALDTIAHC